MAFADFTLTDFGVRWLAQAVSDAQNGTHQAAVSAMLFGLADADTAGTTPMSGFDLWTADTTSLRIFSSGSSVGVRGIASNVALTEIFYDFCAIQLTGRIGAESGIIAWCVSDTPENIPPADEQVVQRTMTINFAAGAEASITCDAVQSGYALEDGVAKLAPATNDADLDIGATTLQHSYGLSGFSGRYARSQVEWESSGGSSYGLSAYPPKNAVLVGPALYTPGGAEVGGQVKAGSAAITGNISIGGSFGVLGDAAFSGLLGGNAARLMAENCPAIAVYDGATFTVWDFGGIKHTGVAYSAILSTLNLPARNGLFIAFQSGGSVQVSLLEAGVPRQGVSGDARLVLVFLA